MFCEVLIANLLYILDMCFFIGKCLSNANKVFFLFFYFIWVFADHIPFLVICYVVSYLEVLIQNPLMGGQIVLEVVKMI